MEVQYTQSTLDSENRIQYSFTAKMLENINGSMQRVAV